jgi:sulfur carrier protein ThiS
MKVVVRFMGRMGEGLPGYDPQKGLSVEIPDGAMVEDLVDHLRMPKSQTWMVVLDGRILKSDVVLMHNACLYVVPAVFGG